MKGHAFIMIAKKKRRSFILKLAMLCFVIYVVITLVQLFISINKATKENLALKGEIDQQMVENDKIISMLDSEIDEEYIAQIARNKLGYIMPDEIVYKDSSGK